MVCLSGMLGGLLLHAQEPQVAVAPGSTLKVESHLVEMTVSVRDRQDHPVAGLAQSAFHVTEDGVSQPIRYFAQERELPLSIGLILDASGSQSTFVKSHEDAVRRFLQQVVEPKDKAFAVCFGNHLRLASDWADSAAQVVEQIHRFDKGERDFPVVGPDEDRDLGTALYDAIYFPIAEKMKDVRGRRKVLLLLTDGEENSSEHDLLDAIREAQNENVLIFAIRTTEAKPKRQDARDRYGIRVLEHLTEETGGRVFDASASNLDEDFAEIASELRNLYEVGYYSTHHERDGRFRKVTVDVDGDGLSSRARSGYMAR